MEATTLRLAQRPVLDAHDQEERIRPGIDVLDLTDRELGRDDSSVQRRESLYRLYDDDKPPVNIVMVRVA